MKVKTKKGQERASRLPDTRTEGLLRARGKWCCLCLSQRERGEREGEDLTRPRPWRKQVVFLKVPRSFQKAMTSQLFSLGRMTTGQATEICTHGPRL